MNNSDYIINYLSGLRGIDTEQPYQINTDEYLQNLMNINNNKGLVLLIVVLREVTLPGG